MKYLDYEDNPQILDQLKANIREAIVEILPKMCQKVQENYLKSIEVSRGRHFNAIDAKIKFL